MLHLKVDDLAIKFSFRHIHNCGFEVRPGKIIDDVTSCRLEVNGVMTKGIAACLQGDKFEKEVGRKLSLTRALSESGLVRSVRKHVWNTYFNRGVDHD
jgi:hypothetical protein